MSSIKLKGFVPLPKLSLNHGSKITRNVNNLRLLLHEINPGEVGIIINQTNIIMNTT